MASPKAQTADAPTFEELAKNESLMKDIERALIAAKHHPKRHEGVIHHINDRFTNLWVMPKMRNTKVVCGQFILRIGTRDQVWERPNPHSIPVIDLIDWIEEWMENTTDTVHAVVNSNPEETEELNDA